MGGGGGVKFSHPLIRFKSFGFKCAQCHGVNQNLGRGEAPFYANSLFYSFFNPFFTSPFGPESPFFNIDATTSILACR